VEDERAMVVGHGGGLGSRFYCRIMRGELSGSSTYGWVCDGGHRRQNRLSHRSRGIRMYSSQHRLHSGPSKLLRLADCAALRTTFTSAPEPANFRVPDHPTRASRTLPTTPFVDYTESVFRTRNVTRWARLRKVYADEEDAQAIAPVGRASGIAISHHFKAWIPRYRWRCSFRIKSGATVRASIAIC
jgi:hypothetical protein